MAISTSAKHRIAGLHVQQSAAQQSATRLLWCAGGAAVVLAALLAWAVDPVRWSSAGANPLGRRCGLRPETSPDDRPDVDATRLGRTGAALDQAVAEACAA